MCAYYIVISAERVGTSCYYAIPSTIKICVSVLCLWVVSTVVRISDLTDAFYEEWGVVLGNGYDHKELRWRGIFSFQVPYGVSLRLFVSNKYLRRSVGKNSIILRTCDSSPSNMSTWNIFMFNEFIFSQPPTLASLYQSRYYSLF